MPKTALKSVDEFLDLIEKVDFLVMRIGKDTDTGSLGDMSPIEISRVYAAVRLAVDRADEVLAPLYKNHNQMRDLHVPAIFDRDKVSTINLDEGFRITVAHNVRAAIRAGKKEEAYAWLHENGLGDLITNTVNASTLSATAKTLGEENRELNGELFNVHVLPTTSFTRTKRKTANG